MSYRIVRRYVAVLGLFAMVQPAQAEEQLTPIQQYLQYEAGYAPPMLGRDDAKESTIPAPPPKIANEDNHLMSGVSGMNL